MEVADAIWSYNESILTWSWSHESESWNSDESVISLASERENMDKPYAYFSYYIWIWIGIFYISCNSISQSLLSKKKTKISQLLLQIMHGAVVAQTGVCS